MNELAVGIVAGLAVFIIVAVLMWVADCVIEFLADPFEDNLR